MANITAKHLGWLKPGAQVRDGDLERWIKDDQDLWHFVPSYSRIQTVRDIPKEWIGMSGEKLVEYYSPLHFGD